MVDYMGAFDVLADNVAPAALQNPSLHFYRAARTSEHVLDERDLVGCLARSCIDDVELWGGQTHDGVLVQASPFLLEVPSVCFSDVEKHSRDDVGGPCRLCFDEHHETRPDGESEVVVVSVGDHPFDGDDLDVIDIRIGVFGVEHAV